VIFGRFHTLPSDYSKTSYPRFTIGKWPSHLDLPIARGAPDRSVKGSLISFLYITHQRTAAAEANGRRTDMYRTIAQIFQCQDFDAISVSDIARALGLT